MKNWSHLIRWEGHHAVAWEGNVAATPLSINLRYTVFGQHFTRWANYHPKRWRRHLLGEPPGGWECCLWLREGSLRRTWMEELGLSMLIWGVTVTQESYARHGSEESKTWVQVHDAPWASMDPSNPSTSLSFRCLSGMWRWLDLVSELLWGRYMSVFH